MQMIKTLASINKDPTGCAMDFEQALANGWRATFRNSLILGDFFHFMDANKRNLRRLFSQKENDIRCDIKQGLRELWYADTEFEFNTMQVEFLRKWDELAPAYTAYYRQIWNTRYSPSQWASYK
jgi:hypothetical protein